MVIISDTTTLSNLLVVGKIHILRDLYSEVIIPPVVQQELLAFATNRFAVEEVLAEGWLRVEFLRTSDLFTHLHLTLDAGEAQAIALSVDLRVTLLIIDELAGRTKAREHGVPIIGLLGILVEAKRENLLLNVQDTLNELILKAGFWVTPVLKKQVLQSAGEWP